MLITGSRGGCISIRITEGNLAGRCIDAAIGAELILELADSQHETHAGVTSGALHF
jgi:hypothetical protein